MPHRTGYQARTAMTAPTTANGLDDAALRPPLTTLDPAERLVLDGLLQFAAQEVGPVEAELGEILHDPRLTYGADGREVPVLTEARRRVRVAAGRAGYYAMFCPPEIGGGG